jgi:hypothetical protein
MKVAVCLRGQDWGVLFENSIVCLVVFVCLFLAACGGGLPVFLFSAGGFVFLPVLTGCFGQACSDSNSPAFWVGLFLFGEFDSGSGRTLAACLTHASRTERPFGVLEWRTGE